MAYKKRRRRGTWFPILPFGIGTEGSILAAPDTRTYAVSGSPSRNCEAIPIIPDQTPSDAQQGFTLRDQVEGQAFILQRVVGKIQWQVEQRPGENFDDFWPFIVCCSALAVLTVPNDIDSQGNPELISEEWDPLLAENMDKPYIWRRTWVLCNNAATAGLGSDQWNGPASNAFFSSIQDGPHIDTKSKRRVSRNQRLFLIHSVLPAATAGGETTQATSFTRVTADLRVFGTMVKQRNTGTLQ